MTEQVAIIDYGSGNVRSVCNMARSLGVTTSVVTKASQVRVSNRFILPGVGHFSHAMKSLEDLGLVEALTEKVVIEGAPILGICLGAQLMTRRSDESDRQGLGWVDAEVISFDRSRQSHKLPIPHKGWAETWISGGYQQCSANSDFGLSLSDDARFYYDHSFHFDCSDIDVVLFRAHYGYEFAAGFLHKNVIGVQFHPEKSHRFGRDLLAAFCAWNPNE